jgi:hypothetical protein
MNGSFPLLEVLALSVASDPWHLGTDEDEDVSYPFNDHARLPQAFHAPNLRHLDLNRVRDVTELNLPLLSSLTGLISLTLIGIPFSVFLSIEYLMSRLSLMPLLERLALGFDTYFPSDDPDIEAEPTVAQNVKQIPFPNLSEIFFKGTSSYLEALTAQISAPPLKTFTAEFFDKPSSSLPHLSHLLSTAAELRLPVASIVLSHDSEDDPIAAIRMAGSEHTLDRGANFVPFQLGFRCESLREQLTSIGHICASLSPILSTVERLRLDFNEGSWQREELLRRSAGIEDDAWLELFRPFCNVMKLQVDDGLLEDLDLALVADDNGSSLEILPELRKIVRPDYGRFMDLFGEFIDDRQDVGQHIIKRRRLPIWRYPRMKEEGPDASEDEKEENEGDGDKESEDREVLESGVEGERKEADGADADHDANAETSPDLNSVHSDDPESSTELDSDSDFDFDPTFNPHRCRFALHA